VALRLRALIRTATDGHELAVTAVLECLDRIRSIMSDLETNGSEPEGDDSALIERLNHIAEGGAAPVAEKPAAAAPKSQPKAEAVATKSATQSIYEQIGGMGTIDAVVEVMFSRVMGDLRIKHLFDGVNMDRLQGRMREYLSLVAGGPNTFGKVDLKCPHASAVGKGMNDTHFDAFAGHMQAALNAVYHLPVNDWRTYDARIDAVTLADLQAFARRYFRPEARVQLVVKP
jgi:truncated hemoglobin YjbI